MTATTHLCQIIFSSRKGIARSITNNGIEKLIIVAVIALFTIIRTDRNMLLACYSHKHISYRIRTIIRKAILWGKQSTRKSIRSFHKTTPHPWLFE
nr:hypothetical protein [Wolbachia endosymbiont (group A) of Scambus nigricans]